MGLIAEAYSAKDHVKIKGFKLVYVLERRWCGVLGHQG